MYNTFYMNNTSFSGARKMSLFLSAKHIPGKLNVLADAEQARCHRPHGVDSVNGRFWDQCGTLPMSLQQSVASVCIPVPDPVEWAVNSVLLVKPVGLCLPSLWREARLDLASMVLIARGRLSHWCRFRDLLDVAYWRNGTSINLRDASRWLEDGSRGISPLAVGQGVISAGRGS